MASSSEVLRLRQPVRRAEYLLEQEERSRTQEGRTAGVVQRESAQGVLFTWEMVDLRGLEPLASWLPARRSPN